MHCTGRPARCRRWLAALLLAAATTPAMAQVPPGMPPVGLPYGNYFAAMKAKLNMTPAQDAQYHRGPEGDGQANDAARKARTAAADAARPKLARPESQL